MTKHAHHADAGAPKGDGSGSSWFVWLKWSVYLLLTLNLFYYAYEDMMSARFTLTSSSTVMQWMSNYAASLDAVSWIMLILVYEIETYWLEDDFDNKLVETAMLAVKIGFAALILQTSYAYTVIALQIPQIAPLTEVSDLCALVGQDLSFLRNLRYTEITAETCGAIPYADTLFRLPTEPVVTDLAGRNEHIVLSIVDVFENYSWLIILAMTELGVRLQNRGLYEGSAIVWSTRIKYSSYITIVIASIYWITKGHYIYAWDEFVWIAGFTALDYNLREWRSEMREEAEGVDPIDVPLDA